MKRLINKTIDDLILLCDTKKSLGYSNGLCNIMLDMSLPNSFETLCEKLVEVKFNNYYCSFINLIQQVNNLEITSNNYLVPKGITNEDDIGYYDNVPLWYEYRINWLNDTRKFLLANI